MLPGAASARLVNRRDATIPMVNRLRVICNQSGTCEFFFIFNVLRNNHRFYLNRMGRKILFAGGGSIGVGMEVGVCVAVGNGVLVRVMVGGNVSVRVSVGVAVFVGVLVGVEVFVGVLVGVAVLVSVMVGVGVLVRVMVGVGVLVRVMVGVGVLVRVMVGVNVFVSVIVGVGVFVFVGVLVGVAVRVGIIERQAGDQYPEHSLKFELVETPAIEGWPIVPNRLAWVELPQKAVTPNVLLFRVKLVDEGIAG